MKHLVIEVSTSSVKLMLKDSITGETRISIYPFRDISANGGTMDVNILTAGLRESVHSFCPGDYDAVSIVTTWHNLMVTDENMVPVSPLYLWNYTGAGDIAEELKKDSSFSQNLYSVTGCQISSTYPFFKMMKLMREGEYVTPSKRYLFMGYGSYLNYMLTGRFVTTPSLPSGSGLMDNEKCSYSSWLLDLLGISEGQLPHVEDSMSFGITGGENCRMLGIREGIPLIYAIPDGASNQLGSKAFSKGIMTLSVGTSGAMRLHVEERLRDIGSGLWCYRSPAGILAGAATSGACNCTEWFRNTYFNETPSFEWLDSLQDSDVPVFLPFIFGERSPRWRAAPPSGFRELDEKTDKRAMYEAVQRGILYNLYECFERMISACGDPEEIRLSGGISNSRKWTQMCADIFGHELLLEDTRNASVEGAYNLMRMILEGKDIKAEERPSSVPIYPDMKMHYVYMKDMERYRRYVEE